MTNNDPRQPSTRALRTRGLIALIVAVLVLAVVVVKPFNRPPATQDLTVLAPSLPDAVEVGTPVDMRSETVGTVCDIDTTDPVQARLRLCLTSDHAFAELTQRSEVSVVSRNVFGNYAVRLTPNAGGAALADGGTLQLAQPPHDYSITAAVRSTGSFTIPVLTPKLSALLTKASDYTTRMTPFVTAGLEALQAMERAQHLPLRRVIPTLVDIVGSGGEIAEDALAALTIIADEDDLGNSEHVERVYAMIDSLGALFGNTGAILQTAGGLAPALALTTSYTEPLRQSLRGVSGTDIADLIARFGGSFHRDQRSGAMRLHIGVDLGSVPGVSSPLSRLLEKKGAR